jgi:LPS O-antigen subunit length determinant protein (WzzB/FepE family)
MKETEDQNDLISIIKFISQNKKIYLQFLVIALILSIGVTFLIPKKYQTKGILFATYSNSLEDTYNNPMFGYDVEADRLMQIIQSQEIRDSIAKKFDLIQYYKLDTTDEKWRDDLKKKMLEDIYFSKTPFMSLEIMAKTKNPKLSADIVNYIIDLIDPIRNRILKQNIALAHQSIEKEFFRQKLILDSLVISIKTMRDEYGNPAISLLANQDFNFNNENKTNNTLLEEKIDKYILQKVIYNDLKIKYEKVKSQLERPLPKVYVIDRAEISNKKASPSFIVNISISIITTLILVSVILILQSKLKLLYLSPNNE